MSGAKFWQDEDGVSEISSAIRELVDNTAKEAVEEFIAGDELWVAFSREDTAVIVASIGDHASVDHKFSLLDMLDSVIRSMDEDDEYERADSPYPAMREAYLKWVAEQKQSEPAHADE